MVQAYQLFFTLVISLLLSGCAAGLSSDGKPFGERSEYKEMEAIGDISRIPDRVPHIRGGY